MLTNNSLKKHILLHYAKKPLFLSKRKKVAEKVFLKK